MNPVNKILGKKCWECGKIIEGKGNYYYHGDQDDLVCDSCAKKLKHTDTAYSGMNVFKTNNW